MELAGWWTDERGCGMKLVKVTTVDGFSGVGCSRKAMKWGKGMMHWKRDRYAPGLLCSNTVLHAFRTVEAALYYADAWSLCGFCVDAPKLALWEAEGTVCVEDSTKVGCFKLRTIKKIPRPRWYVNRKTREVVFAALVKSRACRHPRVLSDATIGRIVKRELKKLGLA